MRKIEGIDVSTFRMGNRDVAFAYAVDREALERVAEVLRGEGYTVQTEEHAYGLHLLEAFREKGDGPEK